MAGKQAIVCILDVSPSMQEVIPGSSLPKLHIAKQALIHFVGAKMLAGKSHEYGLLLSGSNTSNNALYHSTGGEYAQIHEVFPIGRGSDLLLQGIQGFCVLCLSICGL